MSREANAITEIYRTAGDTLPSIGLQCVVDGAVFDLTGLTLRYEAIDDADGTAHVEETSDGIEATDAETGKLSIDCTAIAATAGVYWLRVYATDEDEERRSFPPDGRRIRVTVNNGA